jgi:hypothetical protein
MVAPHPRVPVAFGQATGPHRVVTVASFEAKWTPSSVDTPMRNSAPEAPDV